MGIVHRIYDNTDSADGGSAVFARDFADGSERRLVGAIALGNVQRMFFHEVKALAQLESRAQRLAVVFRDVEQTIDAVVAFRVLDAAGAYQRGVHRLRGRKNLDAIAV